MLIDSVAKKAGKLKMHDNTECALFEIVQMIFFPVNIDFTCVMSAKQYNEVL